MKRGDSAVGTRSERPPSTFHTNGVNLLKMKEKNQRDDGIIQSTMHFCQYYKIQAFPTTVKLEIDDTDAQIMLIAIPVLQMHFAVVQVP